MALAVAVPVTGAAGWIEYTRARAGHSLAWAYVVEWPLIGLFCVHLWWRLLRELRPGGGSTELPAPVAGVETRTGDGADAVDDAHDPDLIAWRDYLQRLHAADPPGAPPPR